jgi:multimeric flavodoxin WrbA
MKVFGFDGSRSESGLTHQLLEEALTACGGQRVGDIYEADAIILATPVQWFNMTAKTKEFIDSLKESPDFPLEGKVAGFIAVCEEDGGQQTVSLIASALNHMGVIIPPYGMVFYNQHGAEKSEDQWQLNAAKDLGQSIKHLVNQLTGSQ